MKWRYESVAFFLCCSILRLASSSPTAGKKDLLESGKLELLEKKINPSESEAAEGGVDDSDDLLARTKKSSTTTTFCVEIKPGNDQPTVVVCDPSKTEHQVPIPSPAHHPKPKPTPAPTHEPEVPNWYNPPTYGDLIPDYPRELQPSFGYEPIIYVPQQPQIYPPFHQQPQVILVRDPSCPSSNPSIVSNFLQQGRLYAPRPFEYPMGAASLWKSAYNPEEEASRSISGGYPSPLNPMDTRRGDFQQNQFTNVRTLAQNSALLNGIQGPEGQLNRQFLVQCNPTLTPIPQNPYATAVSSGKANEQDLKSSNMGHSGQQSQFMYPASGGHGYHGGQMTDEAIHHHHHHNNGLPPQMQTQSGHHYQSNMHPYNKPYNMHNRMSGIGAQERSAADGTQVAAKAGPEISVHHDQHSASDSFAKIISGDQLGGQSQPYSQSSSFNGQVNHQGGVSVSGIDGRGLQMDQKQQQQKMGSEKMQMGGNQGSENRFYSSSFDQGQIDGRTQMSNVKDLQGVQKQTGFSHSQQQQNSFANGDRMQSSDSKDQGFQKQIGFSQNQNQNQQKLIQNGSGSQQKHSAAVANDMPSYSQMLLQRMKSAVAQNSLVQPFMVPSSDSIGEKSTQSKV